MLINQPRMVNKCFQYQRLARRYTLIMAYEFRTGRQSPWIGAPVRKALVGRSKAAALASTPIRRRHRPSVGRLERCASRLPIGGGTPVSPKLIQPVAQLATVVAANRRILNGL